jgi:hypothetical protein
MFLGLANKGSINHLLVFSGFWIKGGVKMEGLTQMLIKLGLLLASGGPLMFCSCSWPFFFLPSCLPPSSAS